MDPTNSTALPPSSYEVLKPNCRNDTVRFLKGRIRRENGSPWRDRVELVGLGFEWQNAALVHGFEGHPRLQPFRLGDVSDATGARDYIAGPDQKTFSPLFPSYASMMANLAGPALHCDRSADRTIDRGLEARPSQAGCAHRRRLHLREPARAAARAFRDRLEAGRLRRARHDRATGRNSTPRKPFFWTSPPEGDDAIAKLASRPAPSSHVGIRHYENTKVVIEVDAAQPGFVVLHDVWHPWWTADVDGVDAPILPRERAFQSRAGACRASHPHVRVQPDLERVGRCRRKALRGWPIGAGSARAKGVLPGASLCTSAPRAERRAYRRAPVDHQVSRS